MNKIIIIISVLIAFGAVVFLGFTNGPGKFGDKAPVNDDIDQLSSASSSTSLSVSETEAVKVIATGLEIPWDIAFLSDGDLLVTERPGNLLRLAPDGTQISIPVPGVKHSSEGGLLGMALHPDFSKNNFIYLYYGVLGDNGQTKNQVVRFEFKENSLRSPQTIIENIPGAIYHDGGRIEFGPDNLLYITTGDATDSNIAQNKNSLGGKILRVKDDGAIPAGNPFGTAVYSYGHRNSQGLAWDALGNLWSTEHGRSGVLSGLDELNFIESGKNYGWPEIQGDETRAGMVVPVLHSGASETWAPASLAFVGGKLYFGGLKGEGLYEVTVEGNQAVNLKKYFSKEFGRIRTVRVGPDGLLYVTTSNRDGRGSVQTGDDKIIRINPASLTQHP